MAISASNVSKTANWCFNRFHQWPPLCQFPVYAGMQAWTMWRRLYILFSWFDSVCQYFCFPSPEAWRSCAKTISSGSFCFIIRIPYIDPTNQFDSNQEYNVNILTQDVIKFEALAKTLGLVMITKPQIIPSIFKQVPFPTFRDHGCRETRIILHFLSLKLNSIGYAGWCTCAAWLVCALFHARLLYISCNLWWPCN